MNLLDIILIIVTLASSLIGLTKGAARSLISMVMQTATIIVAIVIEPLSNEVISEYIPIAGMIYPCSATLSYIISSISISFVTSLLKSTTLIYADGVMDKMLGLAVGFTRGFVIALTIFGASSVILSGSYIGAKNLWDVFHNIDPTLYPSWFRKGYLYQPMQGILTETLRVSEGGLIEGWMVSVNLPSPKLTTPESTASNDDIKESTGIQKENSISSEADEPEIIDQIQRELLPILLQSKPKN
ncbi:MAG: CvpA family protein [Alphaproteobacteria bacterium]|nr:CvpA family protein [Alphaproteobacteria bacterium]